MQVIEHFGASHIRQLHALYQNEWWSKGRTLEETTVCVNNSQLCIGLVDEDHILQGFARVLTDYLFKALIFDVIVSERYRNLGNGHRLINLIVSHPDLKNVKHFELYCLPDMIPFYEEHCFSADIGGTRLMRLIKEER